MSDQTSLARPALISVLLAQTLAIVPHFTHLPIWISILWLGCLFWRIQVLRMRMPRPGRWGKAGLILVVAAAVYFSRGRLVGLDAGVVLLVSAFILKMLETYNRRDALVLVYLGFFVVLTAYLFNDDMLTALYSLLPILALLAAMINVQLAPVSAHRHTAWLAGRLLLQALPLMLLLFVFFPRIGPLWALPMANDQAVVGLSDSMSPGDIAELSQSDELVLQASFVGAPPPREQLYWRALTLERFDGRRWSQGWQQAEMPQWTPRGAPLDYSVILQPSAQHWLPALDVALSPATGRRQMSDFSLQSVRPVERALQYSVRSWPHAVRELQPPTLLAQRGLQLPALGNPRSRAWAKALRDQYPDDAQFAAALLQHFKQQPFTYTLRPPKLGEDSVDEFLFDTQRGFCGHYAGAMTFVLRAAGIPARVVAGYQGGELGRTGNYVQVRQFDAHAWVEYWIAGQGWVRADPTFAVAPERIELGPRQALAQEQSFLEHSPLSALRHGGSPWLSELRAGWDDLNYGWQRWVLNYQTEEQAGLWQRWFGENSELRAAWSLAAGGLALLLLLAWQLLRTRGVVRDPLVRQFRHLERLLAAHGVAPAAGEGPQAYRVRAMAALPAQSHLIAAFVEAFMSQRYGAQTPNVKLLKYRLRQLRRQLPWRFLSRRRRSRSA